MVIGHAYGIAMWSGVDVKWAAWAATIVAFGNMLGGFSIGIVADRKSSLLLLRWLPIVSVVGLILLSTVAVLEAGKTYVVIIIGLAMVGYSYGAIIAIYPVVIADIFGVLAAPRVYGQVFTAWGLAGLLGPWLTGILYDNANTYTVALLLAAMLSVLSTMAIRLCSHR